MVFDHFSIATVLMSGDIRHHDLRITHPCPTSPRQCPKPLISYRPDEIELTTLTMAKSNPTYLIVGGSHPHAFLHDRRMIGRDLQQEWGNLSWNADVATQVFHLPVWDITYHGSVSDVSPLMGRALHLEEAYISRHASSPKQGQTNSSAPGRLTMSTASTSMIQSTSSAKLPQNQNPHPNPIPQNPPPIIRPTAATFTTNGNGLLRMPRRKLILELQAVEAASIHFVLLPVYENHLFQRKLTLV